METEQPGRRGLRSKLLNITGENNGAALSHEKCLENSLRICSEQGEAEQLGLQAWPEISR